VPSNPIAIPKVTNPVVFIGCGKWKKAGTHRAFDLYQGRYFRLCLAVARMIAPDRSIFVLSAKYGVISGDCLIESYDLKVSDLSSSDEKRWRAGVRKFVLKKVEDGFQPVFVCGKLYHGGLPGVIMLPQEGIGIQMKYMRELLDSGKGFGLCSE